MMEIKSKVIALLKSWPIQLRRIEQLRFELEHPAHIGERELIESLALGCCPPGERGLPNGGISNKTMAIALKYQDIKWRINNETISGIMEELRSLEAELSRLEHYISFLDKEKALILRLVYLEQKPWDAIVEEFNRSKRTTMNYRNEALNELVEMYSFLETIKGDEPEAVE